MFFVFFALLGLVGTLLQGYLWWRLGSLPWVRGHISALQLWGLGGLLWLLYLAGAVFGHNARHPLLQWLGEFTLNWLAVLFLAATCLLLVDLLSGFGYWFGGAQPALRTGALAVALVLIAIAFVQGLRPPVVSHYAVTLKDLPRGLDGTRVVAISDLHLDGELGPKWMAARVRQIEALRPNLIVLVGDLFEGLAPQNPAFLPILKRLHAPLGVYAVTGNHEFFGDPAALALVRQAGIKWLNDRWVSLAPGLTLAGVEDLSMRSRHQQVQQVLPQTLKGRPAGATLLLSHSPSQVEKAAALGVDLMLSGHTHGGQIWPFGYLVRLFYPYFVGRYQVDGMTLIVGRGTGLWGPRMRLWQRGEILAVTLHSAP